MFGNKAITFILLICLITTSCFGGISSTKGTGEVTPISISADNEQYLNREENQNNDAIITTAVVVVVIIIIVYFLCSWQKE